MSTSGAVEQALCELERAYERLGYLLGCANRPGASQGDREMAAAAAAAAKSKRLKFRGVLEQYADSKYKAGIDLGRSEGLRAR